MIGSTELTERGVHKTSFSGPAISPHVAEIERSVRPAEEAAERPDVRPQADRLPVIQVADELVVAKIALEERDGVPAVTVEVPATYLTEPSAPVVAPETVIGLDAVEAEKEPTAI